MASLMVDKIHPEQRVAVRLTKKQNPENPLVVKQLVDWNLPDSQLVEEQMELLENNSIPFEGKVVAHLANEHCP